MFLSGGQRAMAEKRDCRADTGWIGNGERRRRRVPEGVRIDRLAESLARAQLDATRHAFLTKG